MIVLALTWITMLRAHLQANRRYGGMIRTRRKRLLYHRKFVFVSKNQSSRRNDKFNRIRWPFYNLESSSLLEFAANFRCQMLPHYSMRMQNQNRHKIAIRFIIYKWSYFLIHSISSSRTLVMSPPSCFIHRSIADDNPLQRFGR